jgi:hypothetical protein
VSAGDSETQRQIEDQRRRVQEETDRLAREQAAEQQRRSEREWR